MARLIDADAINYIEIGKGKIEIALASDIDKIPTISPDEVRGVGEWVQNDNGTWSCSGCHSWIPDEQHYYARFCLFCGARMEVSEDARKN